MKIKKRYSVHCPISFRCSTRENKKQRKSILDYIFLGYQTCDSPDLYDVSIQTDLLMSDLDDDYFKEMIEKFDSKTDVEKTSGVDEFIDVIESGDEEFLSVHDEHLEQKLTSAPHSINIRLKDSPHIILEDGQQKTKISLTPKYLEENGLRLVIEEGPNRNFKLIAGNEEIYPPHKVLSTDVNISVSGYEKSDVNKDVPRKRSRNDVGPDIDDDLTHVDFQTPQTRIGVLSLAVDKIEKRSTEDYFNEKLKSAYPRSDIIQCIPEEHYISSGGEKSKKGENLCIDIAEEDSNKENSTLNFKNSITDDRNFFWTTFEEDSAIDLIKQGCVDELTEHGHKYSPKEQPCKAIEVQTVVHINPNSNSEEFTISECSETLFKRFNDLRGMNVSCINSKENFTSGNHPNDKTIGKTNTHEATIALMGSDHSIQTEPTMEGIPDLTEKNDATADLQTANSVREKFEESDTTEDGVSEIFEKKLKKNPSMRSIENRSKVTDTEGLNNLYTKEVAIPPAKYISSPSLLKALKNFEDELNPLKSELSRLHSEFKNIDIPDDMKNAMSNHLSPVKSYIDSDWPPSATNQLVHDFYRNYPRSQQYLTHGDPCTCPVGTCLGFRRSSGMECQRIRRLSSQASSSEFFREFTRPSWVNNNVYRPDSIWSEPEDIFGDRLPHASTSRNNTNDNMLSKENNNNIQNKS